MRGWNKTRLPPFAWADFRGNKPYMSTGNLATDDRVALILVDYPQQARRKILGRAEIFEGEKADAWIEQLRAPEYKAVTERAYVTRRAVNTPVERKVKVDMHSGTQPLAQIESSGWQRPEHVGLTSS